MTERKKSFRLSFSVSKQSLMRGQNKPAKSKPTTTLPNSLITQLPAKPLLNGVPKLGKQKTCLLLLGPQNDFFNPKFGDAPLKFTDKSSLLAKDMSDFITTYSESIDDIYVSLTQHPNTQILFNTFWRYEKQMENDPNPEIPTPFSIVYSADLDSGKYRPKFAYLKDYCKRYLAALSNSGIHSIQLFPEHCTIGSFGACVDKSILNGLNHWEHVNEKNVQYIQKGRSSRVIQHSMFKSMVPLREEPLTKINKQLLMKLLKEYDKIIIFGNHLSHGVKYTVADLIDFCKNDSAARKLKILPTFYLLTDLCGQMPDYSSSAEHFVEELKKIDKEQHIPEFIITTAEESSKIFDASAEVFGDKSRIPDGLQFKDAPGAVLPVSLAVDLTDPDDVNKLGEGCYLVYSEKNFGSLSTIWSKKNLELEEDKGLLGFFRASSKTQVPEFKFSKAGISTIAKEMNKGIGKRKNLFKGVLRFVQESKKFSGEFVLRNDPFVGEDFSVFGLTEQGKIIPVEENVLTNPKVYEVLSCVPKANSAYKGVAQQTKQQFIQIGDKIGATLELK
eukprot:maker-scaffold_26-snap-gene-0.2-mRNA-1 protein AED:0.00 eAED:0.00 QI:268/1/1/1/1/1/2/124/558